jgi:thiol-disulfide isomerase/thioredoxin
LRTRRRRHLVAPLNGSNDVTTKSLLLGCLFVIAFRALGCRPNDPRNPPLAGGASAADRKQSETVEPIDRAGLQQLIEERNGRILFLNIWATWCAPCVEEFPDLVKLSRAYPEHEVEVVGISADYPDEVDSKILPFIKKHDVPFRILVAKFEHQEDFIKSVNPSWSGALPATLIYDQHGSLRLFLVGQGTFERFKKAIDTVMVRL